MAIEKVREFFRGRGMENRIQEFPVSSATVELAAQALNCQPCRIAKTLSFMVEGKPILIVAAGDAKIHNPKYKAQFATKARMLSAEEAETLVGHAVGGVCPFAVNPGVAVYLDESLKRFDTVFPACGSSNSAIELSIPELEEHSAFLQWIDVTRLPDKMTEPDNTRRQHQAPSRPPAPHHEPPVSLVLLDLDGTLLRDNKTVSDYTLQVLNRCQQEGILIGFCTSRGKTSIGHLITQVKPDIVATNGGATITLRDTVLHHQGFTVQETQTLLDAAYRIIGPDCEITVDTADQLYWNRGDHKSVMFHPQALEHDFRNFPHPAMKVCVQTDDKALAAAIAHTVPHCHALLFSDVPWHSFAPGSATKEAAAQLLSQHLSIPLAEIMAFGDDCNDLGMISTVGRGIAMGNAIPEIKAVAKDVAATNNEDGVAQYLEKLLQSQRSQRFSLSQ